VVLLKLALMFLKVKVVPNDWQGRERLWDDNIMFFDAKLVSSYSVALRSGQMRLGSTRRIGHERTAAAPGNSFADIHWCISINASN